MILLIMETVTNDEMFTYDGNSPLWHQLWWKPSISNDTTYDENIYDNTYDGNSQSVMTTLMMETVTKDENNNLWHHS